MRTPRPIGAITVAATGPNRAAVNNRRDGALRRTVAPPATMTSGIQAHSALRRTVAPRRQQVPGYPRSKRVDPIHQRRNLVRIVGTLDAIDEELRRADLGGQHALLDGEQM